MLPQLWELLEKMKNAYFELQNPSSLPTHCCETSGLCVQRLLDNLALSHGRAVNSAGTGDGYEVPYRDL